MQKRRYPGVSPFTSEQKNIFFGRDEDISKLEKFISLRNQILLYSKSGVGKTSLLNAGVLPKLEDKYSILKIRFNAFNEKKEEIENLTPLKKIINIIENTFNVSKRLTILDEIIKNEENRTLWFYFKKIQLIFGDNKKFLLVFDQFEELFSYPENEINKFKEELQELINDNLPNIVKEFIVENAEREKETDILYEELNSKTVFVIRADRLNLLNKLTDKLPNIQKNFYELKPLTKEQAREAIVKPALDANHFESNSFEFEATAIEKIIEKLSNNINQNIETTQLQIVCQRIEENVLNTENDNSKTIVKETDLPQFKDIFLNFYERSVAIAVNLLKNISDFNKNQLIKDIYKFIEDQLIKNHQRISLDVNICNTYVSQEILNALTNTYLLRSEQNTVGTFAYELSHDTLIEPILDSRKRRIQKEEEDRKIEKKNKEILIAKMNAEQEKMERRKEKKRQYTLITIISAALIISIGFAIFGYKNMKEAEIAKEKVEKANEDLRNNAIKSINREADILKQNKNYKEAIDKYIYLRDTILNDKANKEIQDSITKCEEFLNYSKDFEKILSEAEMYKEKNKELSLSLCKQALALNVNNQEVITILTFLESKFEKEAKKFENITNNMIVASQFDAIKENEEKAKQYRMKVNEVKALLKKHDN